MNRYRFIGRSRIISALYPAVYRKKADILCSLKRIPIVRGIKREEDEEEGRRREGERGKLTLLFILVVLFLVSYYPCDRMHPSIALWESKERIFRENARRREDISPASRLLFCETQPLPLFIYYAVTRLGSSKFCELKTSYTSGANKNNSSIGNTRRASSMLSLPPFRLFFFYIPLCLSLRTYAGENRCFYGFKLQNFRDALQTS